MRTFRFSQARSTIDDDTADGAHETVNERRHRVKSTMISLIFIGSALGVAVRFYFPQFVSKMSDYVVWLTSNLVLYEMYLGC